jgi:hypothetical protein
MRVFNLNIPILEETELKRSLGSVYPVRGMKIAQSIKTRMWRRRSQRDSQDRKYSCNSNGIRRMNRTAQIHLVVQFYPSATFQNTTILDSGTTSNEM